MPSPTLLLLGLLAAPAPESFGDLVKGAQVLPGLFTLYLTPDKTYLEIRPEQFERPYLLASTLDSGLGEYSGDSTFYPDMLDSGVLVAFRRSGASVQLIATNQGYRAPGGAPIAQALRRGFSDSLLGMAPLAAAEHPERKSVLVELDALFLADIPNLGAQLEAAYRLPFKLDPKTSALGKLRSYSAHLELAVAANFTLPAFPVPPEKPVPGAPAPPHNLSDLRSAVFRLRYSLSEAPSAGYQPRLADDRVGHFVVAVDDYSNDSSSSPTRFYLTRWRLEKADPGAALSRPKEPIVFWLGNSVPVAYREAVKGGILLWNRAFERIGFQDALQVRQQPDDADWDQTDAHHNLVSWVSVTDPLYWARGPHRADPRTGEIVDSDILILDVASRFSRMTFHQEVAPLAARGSACSYGLEAMREVSFGQGLMAARGIRPDSPETTRFVLDNLRSLTAHEVGHSLGLHHNFRGSTARSQAQLQDAPFTAKDGLTGSVMDYNALNLAAKGEPQGEYVESTLGPYDYWAIEYAYAPIPAATPEAELPQLQEIAGRAATPELAYGTDDDAGGSGIDPEVSAFDLGADPLAFYRHRLLLSREIAAALESKLEDPGDGYQVLLRSFETALATSGMTLRLAAKYIGGMSVHRVHSGDPGAAQSLQPVPAAKQREALQLLKEHLFSSGAFAFSPHLLAKLDPDHFLDRYRERPSVRADYSVYEQVTRLQKRVLGRILDPATLDRVIASDLHGGDGLGLGALFDELESGIWGDPVQSDALRRVLQREFTRRLIALLLGESAAPEDARSMARRTLQRIRRRLAAELQRGAAAPDVRVHLTESAARIDEALRPTPVRTAF